MSPRRRPRSRSEQKLEKIELDKVAVKEAIREFLAEQFKQFTTELGSRVLVWILWLARLAVFFVVVKLFFYALEKGWIKIEDFKP